MSALLPLLAVTLTLFLFFPFIFAQSLSSVASSSSSSSTSSSGRLSLRHSLKGPFTNHAIPFWQPGAGAFVNETYVRLTPAKQSRTGYLWNSIASDLIDWEAIIEFDITGHPNYGGDGFAFWYAETPETLGQVYGSADYWVGLGIMFDSFNNDGVGKSPLISAIYNDGTQKYDAFTDGASQARASCSFDFRNNEGNVFARIVYQNQKLTLSISLYRDTAGQPVYNNCLEVDKLDLGIDKFFGVSAHTGDVADNHDIYSVLINDLSAENSDLEAVRTRYRKSLEKEQAKPSHREMNTNDFQHHLVTSLTQMLEELNLLELGQIAINDWLNTKTPQAAQTLAIGQSDTQQQQIPPQQAFLSPSSIRFDTDALQRIATLIDQQQTILREIRSLSSLFSSATRAPNQPASAAAASVLADKGTPLGAHALQNQAQFAQIREQTVTMTRRVEDVLAGVIKARNQYEALLSSGDVSDSGGSWTTYGMIFFCVAGIGSVVLYNMTQQSKERFKII